MEKLEKLGFTKSEVKVYLSLLEVGQSTSGPIIDKARVSSSKVYEILERLIQKGIVSYIKKGKTKYFEAANPDRLLDYVEEKEKEIENQKNIVKELLPELNLKRELSKHKQDATIYRGMKGLHTAFYEALNEMKPGETMYQGGIPSRSKKVNLFFVKWFKEQARRKIKLKMTFAHTAKGELQTENYNKQFIELKYLPESVMSASAINIFKETTIIFPAETEKEPLVIVIKNKQITDSFREQFKRQWDEATTHFTGLEGPKFVLEDILRSKGEILAIGLEKGKLDKHLPEMMKVFKAELEKRKRGERVLVNKENPITPAKTTKVKYLAKEYITPLHIEIYGNKVALLDWTHPITTIVIDKKAIADGYRKYFELLWESGT